MTGALPPALLCAALGLALAFAPPRALAPALVALAFAALAAAMLATGRAPAETLAVGCWVSVAVTALAVHWPRGLPAPLAIVLAANAGAWSGAVAGGWQAAVVVAPALVALPAMWIARSRAAVALKVGASWIAAVALLALALPLVSTPASTPEHRD